MRISHNTREVWTYNLLQLYKMCRSLAKNINQSEINGELVTCFDFVACKLLISAAKPGCDVVRNGRIIREFQRKEALKASGINLEIKFNDLAL